MDIDEKKVEERRRLLDHCDHLFRPPASFYAELEEAIGLAAVGRAEQTLRFDGCLVSAAELIDDYELEEFVERAKEPDDGREEAPLPGFEPGFPDWEQRQPSAKLRSFSQRLVLRLFADRVGQVGRLLLVQSEHVEAAGEKRRIHAEARV